MAIVFKKNGRPKKSEKSLVRKINNFLKTLDDSEKNNYPFFNEVVDDERRLESIWDEISISSSDNGSNVKEETIKEPTLNENETVDFETGEVIDENENIDKKERIFVNNNDTMDDNKEEEFLNNIDEDGSVDEIPSNFNPLKEPIHQRSYNKHEATDVGEIEEPDFQKSESAQERLERIEEEKETFEEEHFEEEEEERESSGFDNVTNESMNELDNKDKKLAAKQLVKTVLEGYEMLHEIGKTFVKYPEDKLQEKIIKKEIDPTMEIPVDERGNTTNPVEFFQTFNEEAEEAISYDPEFEEKVRPAMERVFAKKGWGMTDEQYLLVAFGKDAAWKGMQIMSLKKTANSIMNTFEQLQKDKIQAMRKAAREERAESVKPDSYERPPQQAPRPSQTQEDIADDADYEENEVAPQENYIAEEESIPTEFEDIEEEQD